MNRTCWLFNPLNCLCDNVNQRSKEHAKAKSDHAIPSIYQCIRNSKQQYGKHKAHSTLPWSKVWFFLKQVILLGCCCLNVTLKSYSRSSSWGLVEIAPLESFMSDALKCETKITSKSWMLATTFRIILDLSKWIEKWL